MAEICPTENSPVTLCRVLHSLFLCGWLTLPAVLQEKLAETTAVLSPGGTRGTSDHTPQPFPLREHNVPLLLSQNMDGSLLCPQL